MGEASEPSEPFERSLEGRGVASSVAPWTQGGTVGTGGTGGEMLGLASSKSGKG